MLEWFVSSAILLAVLIALHYLLRGKVSPKLQYALWGNDDSIYLKLLLCRYGGFIYCLGSIT